MVFLDLCDSYMGVFILWYSTDLRVYDFLSACHTLMKTFVIKMPLNKKRSSFLFCFVLSGGRVSSACRWMAFPEFHEICMWEVTVGQTGNPGFGAIFLNKAPSQDLLVVECVLALPPGTKINTGWVVIPGGQNPHTPLGGPNTWERSLF